jgi:hypothetical protein
MNAIKTWQPSQLKTALLLFVERFTGQNPMKKFQM